MFTSFRDKDMDTCTLWVKESPPPGSVSGLFRFRRWLFPALMVALVIVLILVLGVTNSKTSGRLWTAEEDMSILADRMESLNASLQQSQESIKDLQHLQRSIQDNKDQLASVSTALQQLAVLDSLSRAVDGLKCSLQRIVSNSSATGPCCPVDWTRFGSDCYFFSRHQMNWNQSRIWCERNSAHLVILRSDQEWVRKLSGGRTQWRQHASMLASSAQSKQLRRHVVAQNPASEINSLSNVLVRFHDEPEPPRSPGTVPEPRSPGARRTMKHIRSEEDFVTKTSVPHLYWVGLTDGRTGRWEWVNQTPYTIERRRWVPGQPDAWTGHGLGPEDEDCAHLHKNGRLNDIHCSTGLRFICQRSSMNT